MKLGTATVAISVLLASAPLPARASDLTIRTGETWLFVISRGQPVRARKASPSVKPAPGQVLVSVRAMMGTTMTISSNYPVAYTYKAELIGTDDAGAARSCTLPANGRLSFEHWPEQATAVRLSEFKPARKDGNCP